MDKLLESIALEVESFFRDLKAALASMDRIEKTAFVCAITMFLSCFLPWFSPDHTHTQSGIEGFATPHFGISAATLVLVRNLSRNRRLTLRKTPLRIGRIALAFLGLGALSTATCIALLIHFGDIGSFSGHSVDVRYGFYLVLFSGIGISGCGIAKFS